MRSGLLLCVLCLFSSPASKRVGLLRSISEETCYVPPNLGPSLKWTAHKRKRRDGPCGGLFMMGFRKRVEGSG